MSANAATIYQVDAFLPDKLADGTELPDDTGIKAEGTFEFNEGSFLDWDITTTDFFGGTYRFTPDNSQVLNGDETRAPLTNDHWPNDLSSLDSDSDGLFLFSQYANEDGGDDLFQALSLYFEQSLGEASTISLTSPESFPPEGGDPVLGSARGNGTVVSPSALFFQTEAPLGGTVQAQTDATAVPVPATVVLFLAALVLLCGIAIRNDFANDPGKGL
jgi:hypothetical protein